LKKELMMLRASHLALFVLASAYCVGCGESTEYQDYTEAELSENTDHSHAHEGAHGGHVIELTDSHAYHAELTFDKATRDITVYFYGSQIGTAEPASDFVFEIEADGEEMELAAKPAPLDGETEETASRYIVTGANVPESITGEEQLDGHFHVTLGGTEYVGAMHAHSHDHDHDHAPATDEPD
jgi:hypothetical protein